METVPPPLDSSEGTPRFSSSTVSCDTVDEHTFRLFPFTLSLNGPSGAEKVALDLAGLTEVAKWP